MLADEPDTETDAPLAVRRSERASVTPAPVKETESPWAATTLVTVRTHADPEIEIDPPFAVSE